VDIVGEAADDRAGSGVDINDAGTRIAVGAYLNDGGGSASGHVRVYDLVGTTWTQVGADLDGDAANHALGWSVALSASGNRLIAGGPGNGSTTGRVKVYELAGGTWTQLGQHSRRAMSSRMRWTSRPTAQPSQSPPPLRPGSRAPAPRRCSA